MAKLRKQSQTAHPLQFLLVQSADHTTPLTGATPTVTLSKNGGAFASPAGAVSELGQGWYSVAGNATDANTLGPLILHATATGGDPMDTEFQVVAFDPDDAAALGLSRLDTTVSSRMASFTLPTNFAAFALDGSGRVQVQSGTGAGQISLTSGNVNVGGYAAGQDPATLLSASFGAIPGATANAAAVWAAATRTLTSLGTVAPSWYTASDNADIVTALSDLVTLLGRTDPTTALTAIKAVADKYNGLLNGGGTAFTGAALANAPAGSDTVLEVVTATGAGGPEVTATGSGG